MQFLKFNLVNKHGVSLHQGEVLIQPAQIESVRSLVHADHIYLHHDEIGSILTTKTGDKHYVSQRTGEIAEMLQRVTEQDVTVSTVGASRTGRADRPRLAKLGLAGRAKATEQAAG